MTEQPVNVSRRSVGRPSGTEGWSVGAPPRLEGALGDADQRRRYRCKYLIQASDTVVMRVT